MKISTLNLSILCSLIIGVFSAHGQKEPSTIGLKDGVSENWTPTEYYQYLYSGTGMSWELEHKALPVYDGYQLVEEMRVDSATNTPISKNEYFYEGNQVTNIFSVHNGTEFVPQSMSIEAQFPWYDEFSELYKSFVWNGMGWDTLSYDSSVVFNDGGQFLGDEFYRWVDGALFKTGYSNFERFGDSAIWEMYSWNNTDYELEMRYHVKIEGDTPVVFTAETDGSFIRLDSLYFRDVSVLGISQYRFSTSVDGVNFTPEGFEVMTDFEEGERVTRSYGFENEEWVLSYEFHDYFSPLTGINRGFRELFFSGGDSYLLVDTTYISYDGEGRISEEVSAEIEDGMQTFKTKKVYASHTSGIQTPLMQMKQIEVFPNPATDYIQATPLEGKPLIFGIDGKVHAVSVSGDGKIDVSKLPSGKYWVTDSKNSGRGVFMKR